MKLDPNPDNKQFETVNVTPGAYDLRYVNCPFNKEETCCSLAVGFGTVIRQCEHLFMDDKVMECNYTGSSGTSK